MRQECDTKNEVFLRDLYSAKIFFSDVATGFLAAVFCKLSFVNRLARET